LAGDADRRQLLGYLEHRFGISQIRFADYLLLRQKRSWFLIRDSAVLPAFSRLKPAQAGIKAFRQVGDFIKPSTRIIQGFGRWASRSVLHLDRPQLRALWRGEKIPMDLSIDSGYVILVIGAHDILGLGLYVNGRVSSQLPRKEIRSAML